MSNMLERMDGDSGIARRKSDLAAVIAETEKPHKDIMKILLSAIEHLQLAHTDLRLFDKQIHSLAYMEWRWHYDLNWKEVTVKHSDAQDATRKCDRIIEYIIDMIRTIYDSTLKSDGVDFVKLCETARSAIYDFEGRYADE